MQKLSVIRHWITEVQERGRDLTEWEEEFLESIATQFDKRGSLTSAQEDKLESLYANKTPLH